jgi:hypothetical protein
MLLGQELRSYKMTEKAKENIEYIAKILAERKTGSQDNWNSFQDNFVGKAWDMVLLLEQLGFLNKKKFWGE